MDSNTAILIENLTKVYKLYDFPSSRLKESLNLFGKKYHKDFFALKNVSFEVMKGETVGIIGKNGSGKSTLLKIIAGVLTQTSGNVTVNGKVSSLLELGTGFNPEFTGRENIYFSGTIMGYTKADMDAKVEEIVSFADIGEFIDQPVKTYSSGMFARLAFSVAISVSPDILIVDEALSVGDFMFQFKCFQKFRAFQDEKKTIIFVSHSMQQIAQYCSNAIFLHNGTVLGNSENVERIIFQYETHIRKTSSDTIPNSLPIDFNDFRTEPNTNINEHRFGSHEAIIRDVFLTPNKDAFHDAAVLKSGSRIFAKVVVISKKEIPQAVIGISLKDVQGIVLWGDNTLLGLEHPLTLHKGRNLIIFEFNLNIVPGKYMFFAGLAEFSGNARLEIDQRWPLKQVEIVHSRAMAEGFIHSPSSITVSNE